MESSESSDASAQSCISVDPVAVTFPWPFCHLALTPLSTQSLSAHAMQADIIAHINLETVEYPEYVVSSLHKRTVAPVIAEDIM